jgi:hypothetical protein
VEPEDLHLKWNPSCVLLMLLAWGEGFQRHWYKPQGTNIIIVFVITVILKKE